MAVDTTRRQVLAALAASAAAAGLAGAAPAAAAGSSAPEADLLPEGATLLRELTAALAKAPRRRDFKTVPMILTRPQDWDSEALDLLLAYRGNPKQVFDNTELAGPWLNLMRNSMNVEVFSWKHPDFLCVSATHGSAHLALYDELIWDKYRFAQLTDGKFASNTLIRPPRGAQGDGRDVQRPDGLYSPAANAIPVLQRRGAVFVACHNQVWEIAGRRIEAGVNPDRLSHEALAAELTNHLIPGVVLSPGAIGTLPELQAAGFHYAK